MYQRNEFGTVNFENNKTHPVAEDEVGSWIMYLAFIGHITTGETDMEADSI